MVFKSKLVVIVNNNVLKCSERLVFNLDIMFVDIVDYISCVNECIIVNTKVVY